MKRVDIAEQWRDTYSVANPRFSAHQHGRPTITILEVPKYLGTPTPVRTLYHYLIDYGGEPPQAYASSDDAGLDTIDKLVVSLERAVKGYEGFHGKQHFDVRFYRMLPVRGLFEQEEQVRDALAGVNDS